jgi:hypothetical protein
VGADDAMTILFAYIGFVVIILAVIKYDRWKWGPM